MTERPCDWPEAKEESATYKVGPINERLMFFCKEHLLDYAEGVNESQ